MVREKILAGAQVAWRATTSATRNVVTRVRGMIADSLQIGDHLIAHGWPPLSLVDGPDQTSFAASLRACNPEGIGACIEAAMISHYTGERIGGLFTSWERNGAIVHRMPILREVVDAHKEGRYFLTVPVLFAQIEGCVADAFNVKGKLRGTRFDELTRLMVKGTFDFPGNEVARKFWAAQVRVAFEHGNPIRSELSRHAIAHGADTVYGTEARSLKGLLFFDFLEVGLRDALVVDDEIAHRPGCQKINGQSRALGYVRHRMAAQFTRVPFGAFCDSCRPQAWPHDSSNNIARLAGESDA
jgi:hypothetical protein